MEQIMITKPNGSIVPIASKSTATAIKSAKQTWELLGNDVVSVNVESPFPQTYGIGDRITVFGRQYKLHRLPKVKKTGMHAFSYDLEFEGVQYDLMRATYDLTIDTTNNELQDVQADTLTGNLYRFATVLIANANRVFPGMWVLGSCPETDTLTLTFGESDNCLSVLQNLCSESNFNVEFEIVQSGGVFTINFMDKAGQIFPHTFQFGKGKGFYSLDRQNVDSSNIVTRLKVYGSTSNITSKYRATRLCLPGCSKGQSYIEKAEAVAKYGIYEATKYFDKIKPTFNGSITGLVSGSVLKFIDTKMFDLNATEPDGKTTKYLLPGVSAKIRFNTGNLVGYEFDVHAYDHATNTFTLVKITDERGDAFPSESSLAFQFAVGDEYKILDVALPPEYETEAENRLANDGDTYYDQNSQPKVQYGLSVTKAYLQQFVGDGTTVNIFAPGDYIPIKDVDIDVDKSVRIKSLIRNLLDEYDYSLTISDTVTTNITNRVISELIDHDKIITINNLKDPARARANWRSSREVLNMVFDPEGDYYTDKIKPESIDTIALSVGAKSMQFGLTNTVLQPNYNGNKNVIEVTGGVLTHYTIDENSARSWALADNTTTFNTDTQAYYIYAKCERVGTDGSIIFSSEQINVEQDANYYHFWIGIVNSVDVDLNARSVALSYGFTMINGRFIKTGRIESADGLTYFDLDNSEIGGRINFKDGLISGGIGIGNEDEINAGMNGAGDSDSDIRLWAGASKENMATAPFRVMQDGSFVAGKADITGKIIATSGEFTGKIIAKQGKIGNFNIDNGGLTNDFNSDAAYIIFRYDPASIFAGIGTNVFPSTTGSRGVARFENHESQRYFGRNIALYLSAKNGEENDAIYMANGFISGFAINQLQISGSITLTNEHCHISCYNTSDITLTLPAPTSAQKGKVYYIRRMKTANVKLVGKIHKDGEVTETWSGGGCGDTVMLVNDGQFWCYNYIVR
jgi:hypothetical protein